MTLPNISDDAKQILRAGLDWLYHTEQPDDATVSHHGLRSPTTDGRYYGFIPAGYNGKPVVTVHVAAPHYDGVPSEGKLTNPLVPGELDALVLQLEQLGFRSTSTWNGHYAQGSVGLWFSAHPSLLAALAAHCPDHQGPLCSWDGCPWYSTHTAKLKAPQWLQAAQSHT